MKLKTFLSVLILLVFTKFVNAQSVPTISATQPIIPTPEVYKLVEGQLMLSDNVSICSKDLPENIKAYLIEKFNHVYELRTTVSAVSKDIVFKKIANVPKDWYSINVNETVTITYSSDESCFYAVVSLLQMIEGDNGALYIQKCFVQDAPNFQWRGLHLDVARHFYTVEEVKRFIDLMALYKFNTFHWHLTDDQGWRIEIKKYPKLTEIGAWRDSTVNAHYSANPRTYTVEKYGGYYTQEQLKEVVDYAAKQYITIVPEIEMPGHARAALAAYPEYSCTGESQGVPGLWGVFDDIFCAHESTFDFLYGIMDEVLELFPSTYIHIGGDEAPKARWKKCKKCQAVIRENGLKDEHQLQSYFIGKMDVYLTSKGRKLIGWDEILEGGLSPNAAVMSWRGFDGGIEAAKQEHFVVMSPGSHCYFDHYQSDSPSEPLAIGGFTPIEKVYEFNPVPNGFNNQQAYYILGGQANLWTEYIRTLQQLEYMTYPRALALSQALWCGKKPEYSEFKSTLLNRQFAYLERYNVNFSKAVTFAKYSIKNAQNGVKLELAKEADDQSFIVHYSDNKSAHEHGLTKGDSIFFERTKGNIINPVTVEISNKFTDDKQGFTIVQHPSLGLQVALITKPSAQYAGKGGETLTDGIIGTRPWKGNEWLGFQEQEIEFQVDLGKKAFIDSIDLSFLQDEGSWIHHPNLMRFSVSKNGKKWKYIKNAEFFSYKYTIDPKSLMPYRAILKSKGRYVNIKLTTFDVIPEGLPGENNVPWTFMDELIIYFK
jgi:hexosaminidase